VTTQLKAAQNTPGIFTVTGTREAVTLWGTGFGPVQSKGDYEETTIRPFASVGGVPATIPFSGLAPGWFGLYQINVALPETTEFPALLDFRFDGYQARLLLNPQP
jgi:hypothetical protein